MGLDGCQITSPRSTEFLTRISISQTIVKSHTFWLGIKIKGDLEYHDSIPSDESEK